MPEPMRMLGVGSRFSILMLAVATLGGQAGCSTGTSSTAGAGSETAAAPAERASAGPQQVVQRMVGKTTSAESNAPAPDAPASAAGEAVAGEARASAAGVSRASAGALAPRASSVETITSKHLEAELNRLEAELAN